METPLANTTTFTLIDESAAPVVTMPAMPEDTFEITFEGNENTPISMDGIYHCLPVKTMTAKEKALYCNKKCGRASVELNNHNDASNKKKCNGQIQAEQDSCMLMDGDADVWNCD